MSWTQVACVLVWLGIAWLTRLDRVFIIVSVLLGIYFNLGSRRVGSFSAYNIFNKGFVHLLGDLRAEQIDAELRNQVAVPRRVEEEEKKKPIESVSSRDVNKLCACGSNRKWKKCCGAITVEEKQERQLLRREELELQSRKEKYQFL